jgi:hypothetical protein
MEALIADHNDRLVPVHFKKLIQLARFASFPAMGASGKAAGLHV